MLVYSPKLGDEWKEEFVVSGEGEIRKWLLVFVDQMPRVVDVKIHLRGRQSRAELMMAYVGRGEDETSASITLLHEAPETFGRVTVKSALFDRSRFVFRGMLAITPEGKGSDSYLLAKGLMVSPHTRAEIYPYLEIKTDEVRASHGSSVGRLNEEELFYLSSRGVSRLDAERIILSGYFQDVASHFPPEYAEKFFQSVNHELA